MPIRTSPKDVFLHLLAIASLYTSAISFMMLLFQYINVLLPDILENNYYALSGAYNSIRWSIASLVVVFPVYVLTGWSLDKGYRKSPAKRDLGIRKWLIHFTLFAAALIIIGDLFTLIYNLLGGELTPRFLLKVATVFFVSGSVFGYYLWDLRKYKTE